MKNNAVGLKGQVIAELWTPRKNFLLGPTKLLLAQRVISDNLVTRVGDQYYGDRAAQVASGAKTITAITNATTAVVTTNTAHGFTVGDRVTIAGVTPSGYNGSWAIVSTPSTTTFGIYVGTALGAGSAFGTATGLSIGMIQGMQLGTGVTAADKTGAGAAIGTLVASSLVAIDAGFPTSALQGSSRRIQWKTTWNPGVATANDISEVVLTNQITSVQTVAPEAATIARAILSSTVDKAAGDTLSVTWNHDILGA